MKFVLTFAALALSSTEAVKLKTTLKQMSEEGMEVESNAAPKRNTLSAVNSLAKAYNFHQKEEKILESINDQLQQYWKSAADQHMVPEKLAPAPVKVIQIKAAVKTVVKAKAEAKVVAKKVISKEGASPKLESHYYVKTKTEEKKPDKSHFLSLFDDSNVQLAEENVSEDKADQEAVQLEEDVLSDDEIATQTAEEVDDDEDVMMEDPDMDQEMGEDEDVMMEDQEMGEDVEFMMENPDLDQEEGEDEDLQLNAKYDQESDDQSDDEQTLQINKQSPANEEKTLVRNKETCKSKPSTSEHIVVKQDQNPLYRETLICNGKTCEVQNVRV